MCWGNWELRLSKGVNNESVQWMECVPWELSLGKGVNNEKPPPGH